MIYEWQGKLLPDNGNIPEVSLHWQHYYEEDGGPTAAWIVVQPSKMTIGLGLMTFPGYSYTLEAKIKKGHYGR